MNYPIWETTFWGGGTWIALISVLHVYISHLAVGGGFFLWLVIRKAHRENQIEWLDYARQHMWFFLYLTMVFGGVSGVGIWFIIALVNPAGTSILIHHFVFGWAIEWVFFVVEIVSLLLLAYRFDALDQCGRQRLAFLYALSAWLSLFVINGILTFMLTPGRWLQTHHFWDGFFNPTFWPALLFRTIMAIMIAGLFGYVTAVTTVDARFRTRLMRYCSLWLLAPIPLGGLAAFWYFQAVPETTRWIAFNQNLQTPPFVKLFLGASAILFIGGTVLALRSRRIIQSAATAIVVVVGLSWIGGFEYLREISRKPFVITDVMYSNSILASDVERLNRDGILSQARWTALKQANPEHMTEAGRELFNLQCLACHTIGGVRNDILRHLAGLTYQGILSHLRGQGRLLMYMPPVVGTAEEKQALAAYLAQISGKTNQTENVTIAAKPPSDLPPLPQIAAAQEKDKYVLLAWSEFGIHSISDCDPAFLLMPPGNTLGAQLVKCDLRPEIVGEDIELTYRIESGFENPASTVPFWEHMRSNLGTNVASNVGLSGQGLKGSFVYDQKTKSFSASSLPVVPYPDTGGFNPYPVFTVEATERKSGRLLAAVNVVSTVSTELGCRYCHGGGWRTSQGAGISQETAENILRVHDRINRTQLLSEARAGRPQACQNCHADPISGAPGKPGILNLSAAVHGWHANYMHKEGAQACALCHPTAENGASRCYRGIHAMLGIACTKCHGSMNDHALALLKNQEDSPSAKRLMQHLTPNAAPNKAAVQGRTPWVSEPDCLNCHTGFQQPTNNAQCFNQWTTNASKLYRNRSDDAGLRCIACHGAPHAEYPALNPCQPLRDAQQPLQYAAKPYPIGADQSCEVCHLEEMEFPIHHDHMDRMFRNTNLVQKLFNP